MTAAKRRRLGVLMGKHIASEDQTQLTILFVDDEPNILKALKRAMYKMKLNMLFAESGAEALEILKENTVHVVVSDMKMPNMSGAQLLEQVAELYPDTFRIVLTGHSDFDTTIQAVNQGKIHRFMQKPWDNRELADSISEGFERVKLKLDNQRLQLLTQKQNHLLKEVNQDLETVVVKRTKQIRAALAKIEAKNQALEKVLFNVVSINPSIDGKFAIEVSDLTGLLARKLHVDKAEIKRAQYAAMICEIGLLGLSPEDYDTPFEQMTFEQQSTYLSQTKQAALILAPSEHLHEVAEIIEFQYEHVNGSGLYKKEGPEIPFGSRLVAVARDYWRLVSGRLTGKKMNAMDARAYMKKHRNTRYDGNVLDVLLDTNEVALPVLMDNVISTKELQPGMVLGNNLYNDNHILLLPEDHVFNDATIAKLKQYEEDHSLFLKIAVKAPSETDGEVIEEQNG